MPRYPPLLTLCVKAKHAEQAGQLQSYVAELESALEDAQSECDRLNAVREPMHLSFLPYCAVE